jgi:magnesium transporter
MYNVYKTVAGKLTNPAKPVKNSWIDIYSPTTEDLRELQPYFEIPEDVLISVRDPDEVPKLEEEDKFQFILIQTPINPAHSEHGEYEVSPLGILYNRDYVITISSGQNDAINYLKLKLKNFENNKIINTYKKQQLILKLLLFTSKIYLRYLKVVYQRVMAARGEIEKRTHNQDILNLMEVSKSLAYFNRSLRSNLIVVEKLAKRKLFKEREEDEELLDDVLDETKQAIETVKIYDRITTDTANNFANIMSNHLNDRLKALTSITIILMLPTVVASIYGMNVELPFQNSPAAFEIVMGISLVLSLIGILLFYRKKLF